MADWITGFIEQYGYGAVALLMLLETVFPPIPSELVLPFAGFAAARGELHPAGVIAAAACGALAGTLCWYWAGRALGAKRVERLAARHGRWVTLSPEEVQQAQGWFTRYGAALVLFGRMIPGVRSVISLPAGIARMPLPGFLLWTVLGTTAWTSLLVGAGYALESRYGVASAWLEWPTRVIVGGLVMLYVWRVITFGRRKSMFER